MSKTISSPSGKRVRPAGDDAHFLDVIEYSDDFCKASVWFHKRMIRHIRAIDANARPISEMFNQMDGDFCRRFSYYCDMAKVYHFDAVPVDLVETDYRIAGLLIGRLEARAKDLANVHHARRLVNEFHVLLAGKSDVGSQEEFNRQVDVYHEKIKTVFAAISEDFYRQEHASQSAGTPATKEEVAEIVRSEHAVTHKIVKAVESEAKKTRRTIKTTAKKSVKEIRTNGQSDFDKRGPSTKVRERQFLAVVDRMREFGAHKTMLPTALVNKHPSKWIRQACRDIWSEIPGGYHKLSSLYIYCHRNFDKILSLSGL